MQPELWKKIQDICDKLSKVTYENLTKIIRLEATGSSSAAQKLDDSFQNDVDAWMQMAIVKEALGRTPDAHNAIRQAYQINANAAAEKLRSSEELQRIAAPLFRRR